MKLTRFLAICLLVILASFSASFACASDVVGAAKEVAKERAKQAVKERFERSKGEYVGCEFYCTDNAGYIQHGFMSVQENPELTEEECIEPNSVTLNCISRPIYDGMKLVPISIPPQVSPGQEEL